MSELEDLRRELTQVGNLMVATTSVVEQLVRITHQSHPAQVEALLRRQRILVQEAETERSALENLETLEPHRMSLALLERALDRDGGPSTPEA